MVTLMALYFLTSLLVSSSVRKEFMRTSGTSVSKVVLRCSSCCTVRSREVRSFLTGMVQVGPLEEVVGVAARGPPAAEGRPQGAVELDHHQLVQHRLGGGATRARRQAGGDWKERELKLLFCAFRIPTGHSCSSSKNWKNLL